MKAMHVIAALALVAMFGLIGPAPGTAHTQSSGEATITGRITFVDGRPARLVPVDFVNLKDLTYRDVVRTSDEGAYVIQGLSDGEYFVGSFDADRLPTNKNSRVEDLPEPSQHQLEFGVPKGRRVTILEGRSVENVDFVITDIGNPEAVIDLGPDGVTLPASGSNGRDAGATSTPFVVLSLLCGLAILGAVVTGVRGRARRN